MLSLTSEYSVVITSDMPGIYAVIQTQDVARPVFADSRLSRAKVIDLDYVPAPLRVLLNQLHTEATNATKL
jgi:hypothetical protein